MMQKMAQAFPEIVIGLILKPNDSLVVESAKSK